MFFAGIAQARHFNCSNPPAVKWGTYICTTGEISEDGKTITHMTFGTCEGSTASEEAEPSEIYDFASVKHNPALAAKSAQWKNLGAFDVTTELGSAVLYYAPGSQVARVKIGKDDVRLNCF
jgi:hypothetical protein